MLGPAEDLSEEEYNTYAFCNEVYNHSRMQLAMLPRELREMVFGLLPGRDETPLRSLDALRVLRGGPGFTIDTIVQLRSLEELPW